ncbi:MAG: hypothetical protein K2L41_01600, partial [Muribaculaceae bacterium]|nr:hypothetical protein [Muribaculaceae bacterium]
MKKTLMFVASLLLTIGYINAETPGVTPESTDTVVSTVDKVKGDVKRAYKKAKDGTVETYCKAKKGTVEAGEKVADKTSETYNKA